jgi:hypothetical protein
VRQLEVVAVSDDGTYVLLASDENAARATHAVRIDNRLQAAIRGDLDDTERRESELSPKEIQSRLRAGESAEDVAKAAKVPISRVMRYAGPVMSERERIVDQARAAVLQRARGPELSTPLGEVVEKRLATTAGLRSETVTWTARRRDDGAWVVALTYSAKGGSRAASWLWHPGERELSSLNSLATRLGAEVPPAPARRRRVVRTAATKRATPRRAAAKRATAKRTAKPAPKPTAAVRAKPARRAVAKPAAKKAAPKRAAAKTATKTKAAAKPVSKVAVKVAAKRSAPAAAGRVARRPVKAVAKPRREPRVVEPPTVLRENGRVVVPSWSDVLLGVQAPAPERGRRRS